MRGVLQSATIFGQFVNDALKVSFAFHGCRVNELWGWLSFARVWEDGDVRAFVPVPVVLGVNETGLASRYDFPRQFLRHGSLGVVADHYRIPQIQER